MYEGLGEFYIYVDKIFSSKMNISTVIFEKLKKMLKKPSSPTLGPNISAQRFFPGMRFVALNSKYSLVSHIFELGIFDDALKRESKLSLCSSTGFQRVPASA